MRETSRMDHRLFVMPRTEALTFLPSDSAGAGEAVQMAPGVDGQALPTEDNFGIARQVMLPRADEGFSCDNPSSVYGRELGWFETTKIGCVCCTSKRYRLTIP